jgi:hypothetical protein
MDGMDLNMKPDHRPLSIPHIPSYPPVDRVNATPWCEIKAGLSGLGFFTIKRPSDLSGHSRRRSLRRTHLSTLVIRNSAVLQFAFNVVSKEHVLRQKFSRSDRIRNFLVFSSYKGRCWVSLFTFDTAKCRLD